MARCLVSPTALTLRYVKGMTICKRTHEKSNSNNSRLKAMKMPLATSIGSLGSISGGILNERFNE